MKNKITEIIKGRTVAIMAHGSSIYKLEDYITKLKDYDICWTSLNQFTVMEDFILNKINKQLEIVFDTASVSSVFLDSFENNVRLPNLYNFLKRDTNNLWATSFGIIRDSVKEFRPEWIAKVWQNEGLGEDKGIFSDKIQIVDQLVEKEEVQHLMDVPNSLCLFLATLVASNVSKIILFGVDGYKKEECPSQVCYQPELTKEYRKAAIGNESDAGITRDTRNFEARFPSLLQWYRERFKNNVLIYNCSPNSYISVIEKIKYKDLYSLLE